MILSDLIKKENVISLNSKDVNSAIIELASKADELGLLPDRDQFINSVLEREKMVSTGIGLGIAIPHSKLPNIKKFFIIVGVLQNEIEWNSIDNKPVKAIFLIGGPSDNQKKYLGILSKLMLLIRNSKIRNKMFNSTKESDIVEIFESL